MVNAERFFDSARLREARRELRDLREISKKYEALAISFFAEAGKHHAELEKIYRSAMDFRAENEFIDSFCPELLYLLGENKS